MDSNRRKSQSQKSEYETPQSTSSSIVHEKKKSSSTIHHEEEIIDLTKDVTAHEAEAIDENNPILMSLRTHKKCVLPQLMLVCPYCVGFGYWHYNDLLRHVENYLKESSRINRNEMKKHAYLQYYLLNDLKALKPQK